MRLKGAALSAPQKDATVSASSTRSWPIVLIVTIAGASFFLAACGLEPTEPETTDAETPSETTKVSTETEDLCPCKAPFADFRHRDNWWRALNLEEAIRKCITQDGVPNPRWGGVGPFGEEVAGLTCLRVNIGSPACLSQLSLPACAWEILWDENHPTPISCYNKVIDGYSDCDQTRR